MFVWFINWLVIYFNWKRDADDWKRWNSMNIEELTSTEQIMKEFEKLVEAAQKEYPELRNQIETFAASEVQMESFRAYLDLMNDTPAVVTANTAS